MAIRHREVFPEGSSPDSIDWRVWNDDHVGVAGSITQDQQDALDAANAPDAGNPFATLADVTGVGGILSGSGAPDNSLGDDGNFYIDTDTNALYGPKAAGAWPTLAVRLGGATQLLDLGVIDVTDVDAGPITMYTPAAAGEIITQIFFRDFVYTDDGAGLFLAIFSGERYGPIACVGNDNVNVFDSPSQSNQNLGQQADNEVDPSATSVVRITTPDPLIAGLATHDSGTQAAEPWTPNTLKAYVLTASFAVIGGGHLWEGGGDGTTGAVEPDWAAHFGDQVVDNDITWSDRGAIPTQGHAHVYALSSLGGNITAGGGAGGVLAGSYPNPTFGEPMPHIDPVTATPEDIVNALISVGLMAAS